MEVDDIAGLVRLEPMDIADDCVVCLDDTVGAVEAFDEAAERIRDVIDSGGRRGSSSSGDPITSTFLSVVALRPDELRFRDGGMSSLK